MKKTERSRKAKNKIAVLSALYILTAALIIYGSLLSGDTELPFLTAIENLFVAEPDGGGSVPASGGGYSAAEFVVIKSADVVKTRSSIRLEARLHGEKSDDVEWKSADESVAYVNGDGVCWGRKTGKTTVTATEKGGGYTASVVVEVVYNYGLFLREALGHFAVFFALGALGTVLFAACIANKYAAAVTAGAGIFISVISEILQLPIFTANRTATVDDALLNIAAHTAGTVAAYLFMAISKKARARKKAAADGGNGEEISPKRSDYI